MLQEMRRGQRVLIGVVSLGVMVLLAVVGNPSRMELGVAAVGALERDVYQPIHATTLEALHRAHVVDDGVALMDRGWVRFDRVVFGEKPADVLLIAVTPAHPTPVQLSVQLSGQRISETTTIADCCARQILRIPIPPTTGTHPLTITVDGDATGALLTLHTITAVLHNAPDVHATTTAIAIDAESQVAASLYGRVTVTAPAKRAFLIGTNIRTTLPSAIRHDTRAVRTLHYAGLAYNEWWTGIDRYDWTVLDAFVLAARERGAKVVLTFRGSPTFVSARPNETYADGAPRGVYAPPKDVDAWGRMVHATLSRYIGDIAGVECWNEPFGATVDTPDQFTGTGTELAELCKLLALRSRGLDPTVPVIAPAAEYLPDTEVLLSLTTSDGTPMLQYIDWVNIHPFDNGVTVGGSLRAALVFVQQLLVQRGFADKKVFISEWGMSPYSPAGTVYCNLGDHAKAKEIEATIRTAYEVHAAGILLYAYDATDAPCGYIGLFDRTGSYRGVVGNAINRMIATFGNP